MASSWFNGLSSLLSRRNKNKKKLVIEKPLSRFSRYLALERLEDRLNMDNLISFVGGVLTATIQDNARDIVLSLNNGSITFTDQTVGGSTQWLTAGGAVPSAIFSNFNPGQNPTSVTVALNSASYQAGTLTGIAIASNSTNNNYSFGLNNTVNSTTIIANGGNGNTTPYAVGTYVYIGTAAENPGSTGFVPAVALVNSINANGGVTSLTVVNVGSGYTNDGTGSTPLTLDPVNTTGAGSTGAGGTASVTLNASSPLDFSSLGATNVGFSFTIPNAGTVNSLNYNEYIRTKGDGGITISAGSGTGNVNGVSSVAVNTQGSGFKSALNPANPLLPRFVSFSPDVPVDATATAYLGITDGTITGSGSSTPNVGGGGSGYTIGDVLQLRDSAFGNGTGFNRFIIVTNVAPVTGAITNFNQTVNPNAILGVVITNNGLGYRSTSAIDVPSISTVNFGGNSTGTASETARGIAYLQISPNAAAPFAWTNPTNMVVTAANNQVQLVENANTTSTTLIPGGSTYDSGTTVLFNGGALNSVSINSGGTGYPLSSTFAVTISGASTSTVNGKATTNAAGVITSISLDSPGTGLGFVNGTSYTITGSTFTTVASVIANTQTQNVLTSVGIATGGTGTGYVVGNTVTIVNGAGTNATGTVTAVNAGAITAINVTSAGSGFTNGSTYSLTPLTGPGAGGTVSASSLSLATVAVVGGGNGYAVNDTVTIVNAAGTSATGTVTAISGGGATGPISTITVNTGGSGFTNGATYNLTALVSATGTGGSVTASSLSLSSVAIVRSTGSGYVTGDTVTITQGGAGTNATGQVTAVGGAITAITLLTQGTGFTNGNTYNLTSITGAGTGGTVTGFVAIGAVASATVSPTGIITGITRTVNGSGYTTTPTITFGSVGSGTGAQATAVINAAGAVTGIVYSQNYDASATVTYKTQILSINNTGVATATPTLTGGQVTGATVISSGTNYVPSAKIPITFSAPSAGGTTASGFATSNGSGNITSITITSSGSGYTSVPTITFGGGRGVLTNTGTNYNSGDIVELAENPNPTALATPGIASISLGAVTQITNNIGNLSTVSIASGGTGYVLNDTVTIVNAAGTNATGRITGVAVGGVITSITVLTNGTGFLNGTNYNLTNLGGSGLGSGGSITSASLSLAAVTIVGGGTGYVAGDTVTIVNGAGTNATGTVTAVNAGAITAITVNAVGSGFINGSIYTLTPLASATGAGGSVTPSSLSLLTATIPAGGGTGYAINDTVTIIQGGIPPGGTSATGQVTAISGGGATGPITAITVLTQGTLFTNGVNYNIAPLSSLTGSGGGTVTASSISTGAGYTIAPSVTITNAAGDTTGSGAKFTAVLGSGLTQGQVVSYLQVNAGTGYTRPPIVTLTTVNSPSSRAQYTVTANAGRITNLAPFNNVVGSGYVRTSNLYVIPTGSSTGVGGTVDAIGAIETLALNTTDTNFVNNGNYKDLATLNIYQGLANSSSPLSSGVNTGSTLSALGIIKRVSMTYTGANYTTTPAVGFAAPFVSTTVGGIVAQGIAQLSQGTSSGDSYSLLTNMNVTGGTGSNAFFSATGFISRVVVNTAGNYTAGTPTVSFLSGGGGIGATATASIGTQLGSYVNLNPTRLATVAGGTASALVTSGAGNITIEAQNEFSFISIDKPISATGTGSIRLNAGYRPAEGYAVRLNADLITNTGNINFSSAGNAQAAATPPSPVGLSSTSAVLLAGNSGVNLTSTGGGSVFFSSTLDATATQILQVNSSGNFTVFGSIGNVGNGLGDIILGGQLGGNGLNSVWFNGSLIAESLTVNNANTYVRNGSINPGLGSTFNGVLIVGPQIYNNSVSSRPALDLRTVGNNANITMQDTIFVTTANNTSGAINFTTSNGGSLNLFKGLSTTSNLTISDVTNINLGNTTAGVGANDITLGVAGSNGLAINNPLNLIGNVTIALAATKSLSINSTINGGNDLRFGVQGGNISVSGDVGGVTPLRNIILDSSASSLTFSGTTLRAGGLSTNGNFVSGNIDLSVPTTQVFNGVTTILLQASGNILLNAMNLSSSANLQTDNNNSGVLELRGSITNINSQFLQQRASGGTAGASGAVAGVKIGTSSGATAVSITGTNTGGASIQFQGSEIGRVTNIVSVVSGGSGYQVGDLLSISGVSAVGTVAATVTVAQVAGGSITLLSAVNNPLDNFGYNITNLAGLQLIGGSGTGAIVNAYGVSDTYVDLLSSTTVSTLSGGNITFYGRLESTNVKSFTVSSVSGNLTFKDDVGLADGGRAAFPLASFTASTGGIGRVIFSNESNGIGTSGNIAITGNSTISNSSVFTAGPGNISFSGDVSGTTVGISDLTFKNTGSISVGSLGQGTNGSLQDVLIDGNASSFTTSVANGSNGGINAISFKTGSNIVVQGAITVVGSQTYGNVAGTNDVALSSIGNIVMNTQDITSVGNLSLTSSAGNISLRAVTGTGDAIFSHNVGSLNLEGNLFARSFSEAASSAAVNIGASTAVTLNISTGDVAFNSGVVLINDAIITTASNSNVSFQRTLKGGANNTLRNLNFNNAGNVAFVGSVGGSGSVVGTVERIGNITIGSSSLFGLSASGTDFKAASLVTTNPVLGDISLASTLLDLTGSAGLNLATNHDGHVVSLAKVTGGAGYSVGEILNVGIAGTGNITVATVQVLAVTGGAIDSFKILTAGTGYTNGGTYTLTGGTTGATVTVTSNVSSNIALGVTNLNSTGGLTLTSSTADTVTLTGNITLASGITQNGLVDVTLGTTSAITITTSASSGAVFAGNLVVAQNTQMNVGGGITVTGTINSVDGNNIRSLGLQSTLGTIGINSEIGAAFALLSFTANAGAAGTVTIQDLTDNSVSVLTQSGVIITGNLNLVEADTTLNGGTAGNVTLAGNVSGFASSDLILKTNGGAIGVTGAIGIGTGSVRMGEIVIDGTPASLQITGNVYADSISTINNLAGAITVGGSQFITNNVKLYSNNGPINLGSITTDNGGTAPNINIDIQANSGAVTVGALNAGVNAAGAINIKHGGILTLNNNITAGSFTEAPGSVGNIVVGNTTPVTFQVSGTDTGFQFLNPVQLKQNLIILSNSNVIFNGTVDTQTGSASRNLAITVQAGAINKDVIFSGAVGGTSGVAMGDITIAGAAAINAGTNTITALSLDATATGVITLKGLQTYSGSSGLKLTADGVIFVGSITTSNSGNVALNNKNALNILGNITSAGSINQVTRTGGASLVNFGDTNSANTLVLQSTTSGLPVSFDASMVLNKDVQFKSLDTGSITVGTTSGTNTTIKSGVSGSYNLLIQATGGALINLNSDIGDIGSTTPADNLASLTVVTVSASGGKTNIASRTIKTGGVAGQTFTGNVDYSNPLLLSSASGPITFNSQLDSTNAASLTLTSNGPLSFQAIGSSNKVGAILITAASNGFSGTSINAASLKTGTGIALIGNILITGIQSFTSDIDLDTTAGISMGNSITSNTGKIDLTSGGTTLVNALTTLDATNGTITLSHGATLSLLGNILSGSSFTETATQSTNILVGSGGASPVTITVGSGNFSIGLTNVTQLLLNNDLQVTTSGALADVTFGSVIDSAASAIKGITINTTGDIIFGGNIGQATNARLGAISLTNNALSLTATNVNIKAGSFTTGASTAVKGAIDLSGTIDLSAAAGLTLKTDTTSTTSSLGTLKLGPVITTNGGNVVLTHSGLLTLLGDVIANGNITETATGSSTPGVEIGNTTISGTVTLNSNTTNGFISLSRPVTLNQSLAIQASGNGNISISTVDANSAALAKDLTITTLGATGVVTLNGSLGANGALTKVQVDAGASGSIGINGAVITTIGSGGQSFTALNTNYATALILTAGSGPIAFVGGLNSSSNADLTLATIGALSFGGAVGASGALGNIDTTLASSGLTATTISAKSFDTNVALAGNIVITGAQTYTDATTGFLRLETTGTSNMAMTSVIATNGGINLKTAQGTISVGALTASDVAGGDISLTHGGNLTLNGNIIAGDTLVITSGLNTLISVGTNAGAAILIDVNKSDVAFGTNVDLVQNLTIQNRNSKDVVFSGFLDSSNTTKNLSISTTGDVSFVKTVGQIAASRLGDIAISNGASSLTASADVNANSLNSGVVAGTELVSVAITSTSGVGYTASSSFAVNIGTAGSGGVVTVATGTATTNAAGAIISIVITSAGSGYVTGNDYTVVGGTGTITTAAIVTATANGAINFAGTQNYAGASGLTLATTGANGNITVNGVTTTLGAVNLTNSNTLSLLGNISSFGQIKQQAGTNPGNVAVTTGVTTNNTQLTFNSTNSGLDFATSISINQDSQFSSNVNGLIDIRSPIFSAPSISRKLTVSNVNGTINFGGDIGSAANDFSQVVISAGVTGTVNLAGANVVTTGSSGQSFTAGSTNYTSDLTLDAGSGSIGFVGGLNSSNSRNLNLTNTGTLTFNGAVGAVGALGDIRITGASNGLTATGIIAKSLETGVALIGPVSITGTQTYSNNLKLQTAGTNNISVGVVNTTTGSIVLLTDQGSLNVGSLTASASTVNLTHGGTLTFAGDIFAGTTLVVNSTNGSAIIVGTGADIIMRALAGGISLTGPVSLVNNLSATAGAGAINFGSTIDSNSLVAPRNLTLSLTAANPVTFGGDIGQTFRLGDITITGAPSGIDATTKNISAKSFVASASSGAINLLGTLDFSGASSGNGFKVTTTGTTGTAGNITLGQLTTSGGAVLISNSQILQLLGNVLSSGSITESGAGSVVLGDAGAVSSTITVSTTTAGSGIVFGKNITLNRDGVLTAAGTGSVTLSGTVDNATGTAQGLTLNSTSGDINLNGNIGQGNGGLASVNATTTGNISLGGSTITTQANGGQRYSGANTTFTNNLTLAGGTGAIAFVGTLTSGTKNLTLTTTGGLSFAGAVSGLGNISVTAASAGLSGTSISATSLVGSVALNGVVSITGQQSYTDRLVLATSGVNNIGIAGVNTTTGPITLTTNLGTLNVGSLIATAGAVSLTHGGTLTIGGNVFAGTTLGVTTNNGATIIVGTGSNVSMQALGGGISLGGAVTLVNNLTVNASGAVAFGNTLNSTVGQRRALSISTTNNSVTFSGAVGQVNKLGAISIAGTPTGIDAGTKNISADSFVNTGASSGTINIQGIQNYDGALGLNLLTTGAGGNITLGQVTTTAGGVTLTNSNLLTLLGNVSSFGTILQQAGTGGGTPTLDIGVTSNGTVLNIQTTNAGAAIDIGSATKLNQSATLVAAGNGSVDVRSTVNSNTTTARSLNISNTGGTITMAGAIGTASIAPSSALSLININAGAAGTINLNGGAITTSTSAGQIYTGSINLGNADLTLTANGTGVLTFIGNVNGTQNLTMTTAGAINFNGNVGATNPLGDMFINNANPSGFTITGTVNASSLQNLNNNFVNGNISIVSAQNYSVGGLVLESRNAGSITVGNIISGGSFSTVSFTHQGNLNLQGNINNSGTFAQIGTSGGTVLVGTTVPTTIQIGLGGAAFNRAVTLNRSLSLTAPGDISFAQNLNSAVGQTSNLTLNSAGILSFANNVGNTNALGVIDASNGILTGITATNVNAFIKAQSFNSGFVAGDINLTTPQTYSTAGGLNLTTVLGSSTSNITLGAVTTSNGGVVNIQNVDGLKLQGTLALDGAFTQTNNDLTSLNEFVEFGAVSGISFNLTTTGDNISFEAPITMFQNSSLSTGATGLGIVTLSSSVDSLLNAAKNLSVTNFNGITNIGGSLGNVVANTELGFLAITSNVINFTDNLNTTNVKTKGASGQSYTGTVALNGDVVMNAGNLGPVSFSSTINSAALATKALTLQDVNAVQLNGNIGLVNPLSSLSISGTSSALTTFNAGSVTTIGSGQTYNTALLIGNTAPGQINLTAGSGGVVFGNTVGLTSRNLTVSADEIDINNTIDPSSNGVSVLILQAGNTSTPVVIAGTPAVGTLDLTSAELLKLVNGFRSITIGNASSLGNLTVATDLTSSEIRDPFTFTTSGNMVISGAIAAVDNATLSLVDPNYATATITLANAISTQGNVITIDGATQVNPGGSIATTGSGSSNPTGANIDLKVNSRFTGAGTLTLDSGSVGLIVGSNSFNMSGGITITNSGGATFSQGVTVGAVNINATTSGKDVTFNGTLNATSLNTLTGAYNLKVLSGGNVSGVTVSVLGNTGTTTLGDAATDALTFAGGLTANSSSQLNLAGTIATTNTNMTLGNSVLTTNTTLQSGSGIISTGTVTGGVGIKLSLQNNLATGVVNLTGNVNVNQLETFSGNYAVNLIGSNNLISGALTTFLNTGVVTFGDSTTDVSTFTNGLIATASTVNLAGTVATTNSNMTLGTVNLSQNGIVKSGSGAITIAIVNGASRKLSLQDNTANSRGSVVVNGAVNIGQIETFPQSYAVSLLGSTVAVSSASTFNNTGTTTFGDGGTGVDTVTFTGGLTAKAGPIILNSTLATVNSLLDIGTVTLAGNSTLQSGTGSITVGTITDGANSYTLSLQNGTGNQGSVVFLGDVTISAMNTANGNYAVSFQNNTAVDTATTFTNTAGVSFGRNASSFTTFTNGVTAISGTGNFILAGTLKTAGQPINLGNSVSSINLVDSTIIDSGNSSSATISINSPISTNGRSLNLSSGSTAGGTISVNSIDSTAGGLTIANAGGQVTFTGNVGAATGSGLVTITNSQQGVEFQGQLFGSNVNIVNTAASKTIKFGGNLTLTGSIVTTQQNYNVDISGATNLITAANNFNNLGNVNINSVSGSTTFANGFGAAFPAAINIQGTIIANGQVNISKPVNVNGATTTTFNNTSNTISGVVTGSAAITSNGVGTLSLTGNSTGYTGTINANAGNVAVNGNFSNASANVGAAGKISGIGSIGTLTANGGVVSPGNSPGTLTVGTATLGNSGSQATYNVEINGASAGQFDQIKVNTSATLANAVLNITAGGNLQVGQQFQIVSGTTTGQFSNAVSSIVAGNTTFSVTYNANGVLLTVTSVTPSPTPSPTPTPSPSPTPSPTPTPSPSPTPAPTPTPPAPSPTPTPTPTGPYALFAVGAGAGGGPEVKVNFTDGSSVSFFAYDMAYRGGVRVTMGDLNGDGTNEIITGTGPGGGPNVRVFNVTSSGSVTMVANFFAFEPQFTGGIYVAAGNLNGDVSGSGKGIADLIVSAGPGGGPRVIAYAGGANYVNLNNQLCDYFVYAPTFTGGVSVAAGNVVGAANSTDEIITGAGPGGGPHVRAFQLSNTNTPNSVLEYMAFDPAIRNGIYVGAGDLDNDGYDEIFASTNSSPSLPTMVNVRYGNGNQAVVYPFGEFTGGATVGVAKDNNNNQYMVVGAGPGGGPLVQIYNRNLIAVDSLFAFPLNFTGGVFVNTSIS